MAATAKATKTKSRWQKTNLRPPRMSIIHFWLSGPLTLPIGTTYQVGSRYSQQSKLNKSKQWKITFNGFVKSVSFNWNSSLSVSAKGWVRSHERWLINLAMLFVKVQMCKYLFRHQNVGQYFYSVQLIISLFSNHKVHVRNW